MSKKVPLPVWSREAKKAMIDRNDMSVTELAKAIGYSRTTVSCTLNGITESDDAKRKILEYLGLSNTAS